MRLDQENAKSLGAALRAARETAGMSRAALSRIIGRDPATIQSYEAGGKKAYGHWIVNSPSDEMLEHIAAALGTTREALCAAAGLGDYSEAESRAVAAMEHAATEVRSVNSALSGVTVTGKADDVAALLALALERGLLGKLHFSPVHAQ